MPVTGSHPGLAGNPCVPPGFTLLCIQMAMSVEQRVLTTRIPSTRHVIKHLRVLIDRRIEKPDRTFTLRKSLFVQQCDDTGEDRSRSTGAANAVHFVEVYSRQVQTQSGNVWKAAA